MTWENIDEMLTFGENMALGTVLYLFRHIFVGFRAYFRECPWNC
ncbi:MAG: hypothetical protein R2941_01725 [Desulfobacterales bacterium]